MFTITTNSPEQTSLLGEKIANLKIGRAHV